MPTGYTAGIADGKVTDFREYALSCARAFGTCVTLRDDPLSSDIPEFEVDTYHLKALKEAEKELAAFQAMPTEERQRLHAAQHALSVQNAQIRIAEIHEQRARYDAMLEKAREFTPPSPDHEEYAKFLVSQIEDSIKFDCETKYYDNLKRPVPFHEWEQNRIDRLNRDIEYHRKGYADEVKRTEDRNRWVAQLKQSLDC